VWKDSAEYIYLRARSLLVGLDPIGSSELLSSDSVRNVGLFRYWTFSNVPLFLLAAPMFAILIRSGFWALSLREGQKTQQVHQRGTADKSPKASNYVRTQVLHNLAIAQLMLALLTLTTAHVQIITRISSAYPVWLWYAAALSRQRNTLLVGLIVKFMVIYAVIQGGLFASFLPPA
jgi:GPI mannosyltransferase 2